MFWKEMLILQVKILFAIVLNILVELAFDRLAYYMATKPVHQQNTAWLECNSANLNQKLCLNLYNFY